MDGVTRWIPVSSFGAQSSNGIGNGFGAGGGGVARAPPRGPALTGDFSRRDEGNQPQFVVRVREPGIVRDDLPRNRSELRLRHPDVHSRVLERAKQTLEMVVQ